MLEEYETANGYAGKSLNFHSAKPAARAVQGQSMAMQDNGASGPINRITWTPMEGGKVRQHWQTSKDTGGSWPTAFDGLYTPRTR